MDSESLLYCQQRRLHSYRRGDVEGARFWHIMCENYLNERMDIPASVLAYRYDLVDHGTQPTQVPISLENLVASLTDFSCTPNL